MQNNKAPCMDYISICKTVSLVILLKDFLIDREITCVSDKESAICLASSVLTKTKWSLVFVFTGQLLEIVS